MTLGWILQLFDAEERTVCQYLSTNLQSILNLTRTTNQDRHSFLNKTEMKVDSHSAPPQKAVQFWPGCRQIHHLKYWLPESFTDHVDIFQMYAEMGNDGRTEM
jgi:hypothetical protein